MIALDCSLMNSNFGFSVLGPAGIGIISGDRIFRALARGADLDGNDTPEQVRYFSHFDTYLILRTTMY